MATATIEFEILRYVNTMATTSSGAVMMNIIILAICKEVDAARAFEIVKLFHVIAFVVVAAIVVITAIVNVATTTNAITRALLERICLFELFGSWLKKILRTFIRFVLMHDSG